jgi:predicted MFS family arabinose efflux permease
VVSRPDVPARAPARVHGPEGIALAGLAALAVAMGIGRFAFTPILPMMQADAGVSVADGAWLASANYVGYLLGALSAMAIPARPVLAIRGALVTISLATLGMGLTKGFAAWVVLRALAGIASAWALIFVSAWCLERLSPLRRPVLNGTVFAGVGTGIASAGGICLVLMRVEASSADAWYSLGLFSLAVTALVWRTFGGAHEGALADVQGLTDRGHRWDSESWRLVLCYGTFGFGYIIPATFLPVMARRAVQDPGVFGWAWPIFGIAAAVSTVAAVRFLGFVGNRRLWIGSHIIMALGVAVPVVWPQTVGVMLAALLVGGTLVVITMAGMQEARRLAGPHPTGLMAAMTAAFATGQIAGPLAVRYVVRSGDDLSAALLVASGLLLASAWALSRGRPPEESRAWSAPSESGKGPNESR